MKTAPESLDYFWIIFGFFVDYAQLQPEQSTYRFGAFRLESAERRLWREDELIALTPKQFELLFYFVTHPGRVIKKNELLNALWADTYIEETTLARNVSWLRKILGEYADRKSIIETVPKIGYRFTAQVIQDLDENQPQIIIEEQTVNYLRSEETITLDDEATQVIFHPQPEPKTVPVSSAKAKSRQSFITSFIVILALAISIFAAVRFISSNKNSNSPLPLDASGLDQAPQTVPPGTGTALKIGSIVHLKNQSSDAAGYLDAWGEVKSKPEFSFVPTELKFVATHPQPNRENGSGSWKIVSANRKRDGETLVYGDRIHLQNMFPAAGYLDNCGWIKDLPVFRKFAQTQKFAVFTTWSEDRDNGTGTWIIGSNSEYEGTPVLEGASIALINGFPGGGYLNTQGHVKELPAFNDYDGAYLVFLREISPTLRPDSGIWIISTSNVFDNK